MFAKSGKVFLFIFVNDHYFLQVFIIENGD